jgi:hypothetical protein
MFHIFSYIVLKLLDLKLPKRWSTRLFSSEVLAFFIPRVVLSNPHHVILYAGILDSFGPMPKQTAREMPIGRVTALTL